jgi:hypothetical protein
MMIIASLRPALLATLVACATAGAAAQLTSAAPQNAQAMHHGGSIDLGTFHGVVYFTGDLQSYRVVATLASGEEGTPIRFVATLAEGQKFEISVPGGPGEEERTIQITCFGGKLLVSAPEETPKKIVLIKD